MKSIGVDQWHVLSEQAKGEMNIVRPVANFTNILRGAFYKIFVLKLQSQTVSRKSCVKHFRTKSY